MNYTQALYKNRWCDIVDSKTNLIKESIKSLWNNLPVFRDSMSQVPTLHIPYKKEVVKNALNDSDFMINTKGESKIYFYKL